jgi:hypothetical protein
MTARRRPAETAPLSAEAAVVGLIVVTAGLRVLIAWSVGLCYGESYHFSCVLHPSLGYFDHPPLFILLGRAGLDVVGEVGHLALRWPFIGLFAGTTWLLFSIGRTLFGPWAGFYAALLLNLAPVFSLSAAIFLQPDGPLMFFWLACVWCLLRVLVDPVVRRPYLWWSAVGVTLGLAMLSKYSAVLLAVGAALYILSHREQWRWITHPAPYLSLAVAALVFSPVLVWNARHSWISLVWQGERGLQFRGVHVEWLALNVLGQAVELLPWIWAGLVFELYRCLHRRPPAPACGFIGWLSVTPIVLFTLVAAYAPIGDHFHWTDPGYLLLFVPLGASVQQWLERAPARPRWPLAFLALISALVMIVLVTHTATGWLTRAAPSWLAARVDSTEQCVDWALLEQALRARGVLGRSDVFVFTDRWYRSGKVDYALKGTMPVLVLHPTDPRSFAFFDDTERWLGKDGILITTKDNPREIIRAYAPYFARFTPLEDVDVRRGGRHVDWLHLYRGETLLRPYPTPYGRSPAPDIRVRSGTRL